MTKRIIDVATHEGPVSIEADVFGNWAVHHKLLSLSEWTITHLPSGLQVPENARVRLGLTTKKSLVALAKELRDKFSSKVVTPAMGKRMYAAIEKHCRAMTNPTSQVMRRTRAR